MHEDAVEFRVESAGVELAVHELPAAGATVVLVHGFPDNSTLWDPLARLLHDRDGLHVVAYDVRGAGASTAPADREGYRTERLVDDLVAVLDSLDPGGTEPGPERPPVHLVGHDWGSVQLWDAVTASGSDPRLQGRIASFTSISGPSLDHVARFARGRDLRSRLPQAIRSWYVAAFHVPVLPELAFRGLAGPLGSVIARAQGMSQPPWGAGFGDDAAHGVELYRANVSRRMRAPGSGRTDVPVLTVVPTRDPFLVPELFDDVARYAPNGRRVDVDAGHWVVRQQPELVADLVVAWIREHT
jgi:pimeloyl-ACP methyl ester carboxylesterase